MEAETGSNHEDKRVVNAVIEDEMRQAYLDYSMSVIVGRALPDIRDGLKPVHRRILYAMNDMGIRWNTAYKKSARIVGECFVKGTQVLTKTGLKPIELIEKGEIVYTQSGQKKVKQLYIMPDKDLLRVTLKNGLNVKTTTSQKFKIINENLDFEWKEAKNLSENDFLVLKAEYPNIVKEILLGKYNNKNIYLNKNIAYLLGQLISDGYIEKGNKRGYPFRCGFCSSSESTIQMISHILKTEFNYLATIETKEERIEEYAGKLLMLKKMYFVRINNSMLNQLLTSSFNLYEAIAPTKNIPQEIFNSPKEVIYSFISGLVDGDGSIHVNKNIIHYGSVSENLIDRLQILLLHLGIMSSKYTEKNTEKNSILGRNIKSNYPFHSLEIGSRFAKKLAEKLILFEDTKSLRSYLLSKDVSVKQSSFDIIPYAGKKLFSELSKKHIGSGWYLDNNGNKFRQGIKYSDGTKIRYSLDLKEKNLGILQIQNWGILDKLKRIKSNYAIKVQKIIDDKVFFMKVDSVKQELPETTYDIEVEDDHEFVANGIISHNCLGKYHPHGDQAVYDSMARMAQDFSLRYPLIQGQGNWGSQDGDRPAAMRYTEARLSKISQEMIQDIDKETVEFMDNFDGSLKEPKVLPCKFPNLLVNGSTGIAVGMATNIPPHNLKEISTGVIKLIEDPEMKDIDLLDEIKGPDFPTGGIIAGTAGIRQAYMTGRGKAVIKARMHEEEKGNHRRIIITEIPYMINKSDLVIQIADCVKDKKIEGISDLRDESDRKGMRIVIELKKDASIDVVKNQLYKYTRLQDTFGIILLSLVNNAPKILSIRTMLEEYIKHRQEVVRKRTEYDLKKAKERAHILEGLVTAIDDIDNAIALIKKSTSANEAKESLMKKYSLSEIQSQAILDMKLQKLARLEHEKIKTELEELKKTIQELNIILADEQKILGIIKEEQQQIIETYGTDRKTEISEAEEDDIDYEDLIPEEDVVVTMSHTGYVKRMPLDTYRVQRRGGVGVIGADSKEDDFIEKVFTANTHSYLLVFTDKGKVHWVKVYKIPEASRYSKGKAIVNLVEIEKGDTISGVIPVKEFDESHFLLIATKRGIVKKTSIVAYSKPRRGGIRAITLDEGDDIISIQLTNGSQQILLGTKKGLACKFNEKDARSIGRTGKGVIGIRLKENDEVVGMILVNDETNVLTLTSKGYGKQTKASEYRLINRGGKGVININLTSKNGEVVSVKSVTGDEDLMLATRNGMVVRTGVKQISTIGRNTQGVRVIKLREGDALISAAKILSEEEAEKEVEEQEKEIEKIKEKPKAPVSSKYLEKEDLEDDDSEDDDVSPEDLIKKNVVDETEDEDSGKEEFDRLKEITRLATGKKF